MYGFLRWQESRQLATALWRRLRCSHILRCTASYRLCLLNWMPASSTQRLLQGRIGSRESTIERHLSLERKRRVVVGSADLKSIAFGWERGESLSILA